MVNKRSSSSNIKFEEIDQNDNSMEKIFDKIENIPDKDKNIDLSPLKTIRKNKQYSSNKSILKPEKQVDLHGKTIDESILIIKRFIINCHKNKLKNGLIITGKGLNSGVKGPVLNKEVKQWLEMHGNDYVNNFYDAPPRYGGCGAIWVIFKNQTN